MKNKATSIQNHKTPFKILCVIFLFIGYNNLHAQCTPVYTDVYDTLNCGEVLYGHNSAGLYRDTSTTTGGCDTIRTLHLAYNDPNTLPNPNWFNTANDGMGGVLDGGNLDLHWQWSPSIAGPYNPAVVVGTINPPYDASPWVDCGWVSVVSSAEVGFTGNQNYFYKIAFNLPCFNSCGIPLDLDSSFCLSLDFRADNWVHEIYVNGVAQSPNLGTILNGTYTSDGYSHGQERHVTLCNDWQPGINTLIIEIYDEGGKTAFLCQAAVLLQLSIMLQQVLRTL